MNFQKSSSTSDNLSSMSESQQWLDMMLAIREQGFTPNTLQIIDNYIHEYYMEEQIFLDSIYKSMQDSARQIRCSLGRTSSQVTREQALNQVAMLQRAKENQQIGK